MAMEGAKRQDMEQSTGRLVEAMRREKTAKGWTNNELAEKSGVSVYTINKLLAGSVVNPGLIQVAELCAALGLSIDVCIGLRAEDNQAAAELARAQRSIEALKGGIVDRNKMIEDTRNDWKPLVYGLLGLCLLCMLLLMVYIVRDMAAKNQGFIRGGVVPWWILLGALAGAGILLFCLWQWGRKR